MTNQQRAWAALTQALKNTLPGQRAEAFVGGTHTASLADNLLPGLSSAQVELVRQKIAQGDGESCDLPPAANAKRTLPIRPLRWPLTLSCRGWRRPVSCPWLA